MNKEILDRIRRRGESPERVKREALDALDASGFKRGSIEATEAYHEIMDSVSVAREMRRCDDKRLEGKETPQFLLMGPTGWWARCMCGCKAESAEGRSSKEEALAGIPNHLSRWQEEIRVYRDEGGPQPGQGKK